MRGRRNSELGSFSVSGGGCTRRGTTYDGPSAAVVGPTAGSPRPPQSIWPPRCPDPHRHCASRRVGAAGPSTGRALPRPALQPDPLIVGCQLAAAHTCPQCVLLVDQRGDARVIVCSSIGPSLPSETSQWKANNGTPARSS